MSDSLLKDYMKFSFLLLPLVLIIFICAYFEVGVPEKNEIESQAKISSKQSVQLMLLGTTQDAGYPQINCKKSCCASLLAKGEVGGRVVSLGLVDQKENKKYLFEATPDIITQLSSLSTMAGTNKSSDVPDAIFITHAHIGHYTGLMYLGKEAMDAQGLPVYTMPRMKGFLETNGPWDQLIKRRNIVPMALENGVEVKLSNQVSVIPIEVPHRDEYSETVGFKIYGPKKKVLFIPDIDKWNRWDKSITDEVKDVDYAFLDATFYSGKELNNRDMSQIPHPFIVESFEEFEDLDIQQKEKIIFIHFNHTNPVLNSSSDAYKEVLDKGFKIGVEGKVYEL